jgi:hypothetical protein
MPNGGLPPILPEHSADPSKMSADQLAHSIVHIEEDLADNEDDLDYYGPYRDLVDRNHSLWSRLQNLFSEMASRPTGCAWVMGLAIVGLGLIYGWGYHPYYFSQGFFPGMAWDYLDNGLSYLGWPGFMAPLAVAAGVAGGAVAGNAISQSTSHNQAVLGALGEEKEPEDDDPNHPDEGTDTDTREPDKPEEPKPEKPPEGEDVVPIIGDLGGPREVM